jgi:hypothetical protein
MPQRRTAVNVESARTIEIVTGARRDKARDRTQEPPGLTEICRHVDSGTGPSPYITLMAFAEVPRPAAMSQEEGAGDPSLQISSVSESIRKVTDGAKRNTYLAAAISHMISPEEHSFQGRSRNQGHGTSRRREVSQLRDREVEILVAGLKRSE